MEAFDFVAAKSIDEAVSILNEHGDRARIIAGGTDILVMMRAGRRLADVVIDVKDIPELNAMTYTAEGGLTLGAAVPCYQIYQDAAISAAYPGLIDSAGLIGGIQIQGRASIGGNLCNAAPSGDSIPAVIALGGVCHIKGPNGWRTLAAEEFCTAPGQNALQQGEMLVSIQFPAPVPNSGANYQRFIPRNEMDIAVAGVGQLGGAGRFGAELRLRPRGAGVRSADPGVLPGRRRQPGRKARQRRDHPRCLGTGHGRRQADQRHARHHPPEDSPYRRADAPHSQ